MTTSLRDKIGAFGSKIGDLGSKVLDTIGEHRNPIALTALLAIPTVASAAQPGTQVTLEVEGLPVQRTMISVKPIYAEMYVTIRSWERENGTIGTEDELYLIVVADDNDDSLDSPIVCTGYHPYIWCDYNNTLYTSFPVSDRATTATALINAEALDDDTQAIQLYGEWTGDRNFKFTHYRIATGPITEL